MNFTVGNAARRAKCSSVPAIGMEHPARIADQHVCRKSFLCLPPVRLAPTPRVRLHARGIHPAADVAGRESRTRTDVLKGRSRRWKSHGCCNERPRRKLTSSRLTKRIGSAKQNLIVWRSEKSYRRRWLVRSFNQSKSVRGTASKLPPVPPCFAGFTVPPGPRTTHRRISVCPSPNDKLLAPLW